MCDRRIEQRRPVGLGLGQRPAQPRAHRGRRRSRPARRRSSRTPGTASPTSSLLARLVGPSMVMWLSSKTQISLPSRRWPASEAASWLMPSIMQPSPAMTNVWWSCASSPNRVRRFALGDRHADGVGEALAQRTGRDLDAGGVARPRGAPASPTPTGGSLQVVEFAGRSRSGTASSTAGSRRGRWRARTGRGRAMRDRPGRGASPGCTARGRAGRAPSPFPGGRSWPPAAHPSPCRG